MSIEIELETLDRAIADIDQALTAIRYAANNIELPNVVTYQNKVQPVAKVSHGFLNEGNIDVIVPLSTGNVSIVGLTKASAIALARTLLDAV